MGDFADDLLTILILYTFILVWEPTICLFPAICCQWRQQKTLRSISQSCWGRTTPGAVSSRGSSSCTGIHQRDLPPPTKTRKLMQELHRPSQEEMVLFEKKERAGGRQKEKKVSVYEYTNATPLPLQPSM